MIQLKKKSNENEFIIKKDARVKKLEAQIAWFREEALHLSQKFNKSKVTIENQKDTIQNLKIENENLKAINIKAVSREKSLKEALQQAQDNCKDLVKLMK